MEIKFKFNVLTLIYHELKKTATFVTNKRLYTNFAGKFSVWEVDSIAK